MCTQYIYHINENGCSLRFQMTTILYLITRVHYHDYTVKRSDVTGNRFEWQLDENNVI